MTTQVFTSLLASIPSPTSSPALPNRRVAGRVEHRQDHDRSRPLTIVDAVRKTFHEGFANIPLYDPVQLRLRPDSVEDLLNGGRECRRESRSLAFVPVARCVVLGPRRRP